MAKLYLIGETLKEEGRDKVSAHNQNWLQWARTQAKEMCFWKDRVTVDDVRELADMFDRQPDHHNAWGCIFREEGWVRIGYEKSKRPDAHARPIGVWQWKGD